MLDTNVTRKEIAALDARRERLLGLPAAVLAMPMTDAVAHADGNGHPLIAHHETVGEMLKVDARDALCIQYLGKKKLGRLYAMLEGLMPRDVDPAATASRVPTDATPPGDGARDARWEGIRHGEDTPAIRREVARLVQIERALMEAPRPDGGPRDAAAVMKQALAIYAHMGAMDFCGGLEGALENHASAMRG